MPLFTRWLDYRVRPKPLVLHTLLWVGITVFYTANYQRLTTGPLLAPLVVKDVLIVAALFYSLPFIMAHWMAKGLTVGSLLSLGLFGLAGYSLWAGASALLCKYGQAYYPEAGDSLAYLSSLLLDDGFLSVYTPAKFTVLVLDFTYLVSAPLVGRLVSEVKKRDWHRQQLEAELLRSENSRLNAELNQLKAQLPPHFLYNTLNNIHAWVEPAHQQGADALYELAQLTRYVTYQSAKDAVLLTDELDAVNAYWHLSTLRLPADVELEKDLSIPDGTALCLPPMLLMIYIENAFKHGPSRSARSAWIRLALTASHRTLTMHLSNAVDRRAPQPPPGGLGLHHAQQLLATYFPNRHVYEANGTIDQYHVQLTLHF